VGELARRAREVLAVDAARVVDGPRLERALAARADEQAQHPPLLRPVGQRRGRDPPPAPADAADLVAVRVAAELGDDAAVAVEQRERSAASRRAAPWHQASTAATRSPAAGSPSSTRSSSVRNTRYRR